RWWTCRGRARRAVREKASPQAAVPDWGLPSWVGRRNGGVSLRLLFRAHVGTKGVKKCLKSRVLHLPFSDRDRPFAPLDLKLGKGLPLVVPPFLCASFPG